MHRRGPRAGAPLDSGGPLTLEDEGAFFGNGKTVTSNFPGARSSTGPSAPGRTPSTILYVHDRIPSVKPARPWCMVWHGSITPEYLRRDHAQYGREVLGDVLRAQLRARIRRRPLRTRTPSGFDPNAVHQYATRAAPPAPSPLCSSPPTSARGSTSASVSSYPSVSVGLHFRSSDGDTRCSSWPNSETSPHRASAPTR